jgi:thiamine-phosphate pyrophosphorylase
MPPRHPLPTVWLMTDERIGDVVAAVRRLPRGAGVVFRHYATPATERRRLWRRLLRIALAKGLVLVRAGAEPMPGEMGVHGRGIGRGLRTWPAHDRAEALGGKRVGADALFVSPVFPTRSHPGAPALGRRRACAIGAGLGVPLIALGGVDARRFRRLAGFHGWAAIDALATETK